MSAPPSIRQITREALGIAPEWVDALLKPLNIVLGQLVDLLGHNVTVTENLAQQWLDVTVTEGSDVAPIAINLRGRTAKGVDVQRVATLSAGSTPGTAPTGSVGIDWAPTTVDGKPGISISQVFGLASGARYTLTLLVKAE